MEWLSRATLTVDYWCCLYSSYQLSRYLATPYQPLGVSLCTYNFAGFQRIPLHGFHGNYRCTNQIVNFLGSHPKAGSLSVSRPPLLSPILLLPSLSLIT